MENQDHPNSFKYEAKDGGGGMLGCVILILALLVIAGILFLGYIDSLPDLIIDSASAFSGRDVRSGEISLDGAISTADALIIGSQGAIPIATKPATASIATDSGNVCSSNPHTKECHQWADVYCRGQYGRVSGWNKEREEICFGSYTQCYGGVQREPAYDGDKQSGYFWDCK